MKSISVPKMVIIILLLAACSLEQADIDVYFIKFNWKKTENATDFYKATTYIYEKFELNGITLYSKFGEFSGVYALIDENNSEIDLQQSLPSDLNDILSLEQMVRSTESTPLHKLLIGRNFSDNIGCSVSVKKLFNDEQSAKDYITKFHKYTSRHGFPIGLSIKLNNQMVVGNQLNYLLNYKFIGDCRYKKEILGQIDKAITLRPQPK